MTQIKTKIDITAMKEKRENPQKGTLNNTKDTNPPIEEPGISHGDQSEITPHNPERKIGISLSKKTKMNPPSTEVPSEKESDTQQSNTQQDPAAEETSSVISEENDNHKSSGNASIHIAEPDIISKPIIEPVVETEEKPNDEAHSEETANIVTKEKTEKKTVMLNDNILLEEPEKIFSNYESDFSAEGDSILTKIKKMKYMPRTRPALVGSLVGVTALILAVLFYTNPQVHSISNYKAALIGGKKAVQPEDSGEILGENHEEEILLEKPIIETPLDQISPKIEIPKTPEIPEIVWEYDHITVGDQTFRVQKSTNSDDIKYKYNYIEYSDIDLLSTAIEESEAEKIVDQEGNDLSKTEEKRSPTSLELLKSRKLQ